MSEGDQLKIEAARSIREDYLQQNAFHEEDTYASLAKQNLMLKMVLSYYKEGLRGLEQGVYWDKIENMSIREKISRAKYLPEKDIGQINDIMEKVKKDMDDFISEGGILDA